ncbi:MAG TPA: PEP/pyruvate-binding domain-containing protein [Tenuifilaceae bacterium]|nr:PEP/pyruvate-binding domain-containing protein [Tenuifilaceae bacterium]HPI44228.1 PEP/pyruvate-binding domain-containing protein [Tenuifilaceae bacterium]HPN21020.1 PEP/pyruvate-binding domain-containing protein [Tenuifilaceae bacterium]
MLNLVADQSYLNSYQLDIYDTSFDKLMQKRIYKVLLICSSYDAFMLEEDGRIDEQIFNEYVSLNLRYPPVFIQAHTAREVLKVLQEERIDLIISMLNVGEIDTFNLAKMLKARHPEIPIVVLTPFSREVSIRLQREDLSAIDYVFCWLGNADLLLAIIKLIEDKMNADHDILEVGVQAIILVEDSVRYYSSFLPNIYKIVFRQARSFMTEALNEHHRMLRMRGRPKILMATTYEDALAIYNKYRNNILGVISDISYKVDNRRDHVTKAGVQLCKLIRTDDPNIPFLLQSSELSNKVFADELNVGFVHKYSKTCNIEIRDYIINNFGFGDFVFRDPETIAEIGRAADLSQLQQLIMKIPDRSLVYHTSRNDISKWLNARAIFSIAQLFKPMTLKDFKTTDDARKFLFYAISAYRLSKGRSIIAKFDINTFDEYKFFSRIGDGSIGGKARGLAFINQIIKEYGLFNKFDNAIISIPRTVVISTDLFDEFMETNNLYDIALRDVENDTVLNAFLAAKLPERLKVDLRRVISVFKRPLAVRSSSKLEDSHYQPFAGIYSTYMVPRSQDSEQMLRMLSSAIKAVYASVFFKASKAYMNATQNVIDEEKMGIVIQEICGNEYGNMYLPTLSGVARSINFYPIGSEKPEDGIASIGFGLGKLIVDGGVALRFSPKYPKKILQLSSPEMALKQTQKNFYALNTDPATFSPQVDDGTNLINLDIKEAYGIPDLKMVVSTYDHLNGVLNDGYSNEGIKLVTFSGILKHNTFPLSKILTNLLEIGKKEMNSHIEIEFALNLNTPERMPKMFNLLQIRPIVEGIQDEVISWDEVDYSKAIVHSKSALGHGVIPDIYDFVYVKPEMFDPAKTLEIAKQVEVVNNRFLDLKKNYVLVGPGRWGSSDPWLGIPIKWSQISEARVIVEAGLENFRVEPSQGTHFFQNLTSFGVAYLTVNPYMKDGVFNVEFLNSIQPSFETDFIRCVTFAKPLTIQVDGKNNVGIILKA